MHAVVPPAPSRKSLAWSALLFAVPLALAQGATIFLSAWASSPIPWLCGTAVCYVLGGGLCTLRTTGGVDESTSANWGVSAACSPVFSVRCSEYASLLSSSFGILPGGYRAYPLTHPLATSPRSVA
jgi:hypothetical protein